MKIKGKGWMEIEMESGEGGVVWRLRFDRDRWERLRKGLEKGIKGKEEI